MKARATTLVLSLLLAVCAPLAARASSDATAHWYVDPFGGYTVYRSCFARYAMNDPNAKADNAMYGGLRLGYLWASGFGIEAAGGWSGGGKVKDATTGSSADLTLTHASGDLIYAPTISKLGGPFISAGFGALTTKTSSVNPAGSLTFNNGTDQLKQGVGSIAGGWIFSLSQNFGLRLEARNLVWIPKNEVNTKPKLSYQIYGLGLDFRFGGKAKDSDGDGVPDKNDKCPNTLTGCKVDATGCPMDSDGDGVCDGLDKCPGTPKGATVDANGCPKDSDGDGVLDGLDKCPDTPKGATVDLHGCPMDSDGDGVFDGLDKCPDTPTGATVDATGCPMDSDGDGVLDGLDKCPDTPKGVKVDKDGCPIEITEKETELLDTGMIRLNNINFATGKADLLPEDLPTLDVVGQVMQKWSALKIEIGGHTDNRGSMKLNQALSEARANSVMRYLEQKFPDLKPDQYVAKGYGFSKPLVPNTNDLNRAKNRRVEFTVLNKDVLKKEVERRRMLQK
jgi:outer membrane protein OmpA-like peptidoglycan-associated protein